MVRGEGFEAGEGSTGGWGGHDEASGGWAGGDGEAGRAGEARGGAARRRRSRGGARRAGAEGGGVQGAAAGHSEHFLSRLDRVDREKVDFALGLYRDPELVRLLLARVALPEGHRRAAISLDDAREGPFLVVTRDGHFVTCLGKGMSPGELPVVTREKLEGALTVASDRRARERALHERVAVVGGMDRLLLGILDRADYLSREEFVAVSAMQPLLAPEFFFLYLKTAAQLGATHSKLEYVLRGRYSERRLVPWLRSYWKHLWSLGHLLTLATMGDRHWLVDRIAAVRDKFGAPEVSLSWPLVRHGLAPLALRGAWAMARVGKPLVGYYKAAFAAPDTSHSLFDAALALGAIGLRHSRARAEIQKVMAATAARVDLGAGPRVCSTLKEYFTAVGGGYAHVINSLFDAAPEQLDAYAVELGREALRARFARGAAGGGRARLEPPSGVSDELARTAALTADADYINDPAQAIFCLVRLGAVARARAEDFYYPAEVIPFVRPRWRPELTLMVFERMRGPYGPLPPRRVEKKPGRNEPCVCESGKKYKRCCGA